jgi:Kef-type K+ transport system membrane component KefB
MGGIVVAPALARRLRIPALVGRLSFGVLLGPYVLAVAGPDRPIAQFFAELGKLMLMSYAGLEIHLDLFRAAQKRCLTFGLITTIVPQVLGTACGLAFGYSIIPAVVIGSLRASHTLINLPIITRLGAIRLEPVVVAIGATMVSDTLSLIIFGICVSTYTAGFSPSGLALQIFEVAIFVPLILIGFSRAGDWILSRLRDNELTFFITMLGIMALAGVLADVINLPSIVGAFFGRSGGERRGPRAPCEG